MSGPWKDTTVSAACRSIARGRLASLLQELEDRPFSCGHDEAGDPACGDEHPTCCVLASIRFAMGDVVALLGLMSVETAEGYYRDEHGVEQARVKRFLRGLHESSKDLDEGLAQFIADHC